MNKNIIWVIAAVLLAIGLGILWVRSGTAPAAQAFSTWTTPNGWTIQAGSHAELYQQYGSTFSSETGTLAIIIYDKRTIVFETPYAETLKSEWSHLGPLMAQHWVPTKQTTLVHADDLGIVFHECCAHYSDKFYQGYPQQAIHDFWPGTPVGTISICNPWRVGEACWPGSIEPHGFMLATPDKGYENAQTPAGNVSLP